MGLYEEVQQVSYKNAINKMAKKIDESNIVDNFVMTENRNFESSGTYASGGRITSNVEKGIGNIIPLYCGCSILANVSNVQSVSIYWEPLGENSYNLKCCIKGDESEEFTCAIRYNYSYIKLDM